MTTIAYRSGVIAADSRETISSESGGDCVTTARSPKLYRVRGYILATHGNTAPGLRFVDWWRRGAAKKSEPKWRDDDDFGVLVLAPGGGLLYYESSCFPQTLDGEAFYAFGSGAKAALGALWTGATAEEAVRAACHVDPWSAEPVLAWSLTEPVVR